MLNSDNPKGYDNKEGWKGKISEDGRERQFSTEDDYDEFLRENLPATRHLGDE